jgi:hypothetical protein
MPNLSSSIVDAEALAFVTVYAFIYFMQDAAIEYQVDPCMCDDHRCVRAAKSKPCLSDVALVAYSFLSAAPLEQGKNWNQGK